MERLNIDNLVLKRQEYFEIYFIQNVKLDLDCLCNVEEYSMKCFVCQFLHKM